MTAKSISGVASRLLSRNSLPFCCLSFSSLLFRFYPLTSCGFLSNLSLAKNSLIHSLIRSLVHKFLVCLSLSFFSLLRPLFIVVKFSILFLPFSRIFSSKFVFFLLFSFFSLAVYTLYTLYVYFFFLLILLHYIISFPIELSPAFFFKIFSFLHLFLPPLLLFLLFLFSFNIQNYVLHPISTPEVFFFIFLSLKKIFSFILFFSSHNTTLSSCLTHFITSSNFSFFIPHFCLISKFLSHLFFFLPLPPFFLDDLCGSLTAFFLCMTDSLCLCLCLSLSLSL
ncbi:unnamed protein product [Acanthosepion pharaonis]|uniref:Uncharacterized protein n=1 Tax=Acanthosepion pharaonis TaxID=158019 RepID=A0A812DHS4_ACAPH|nr:unnamed protein product [Sepia pharaonis]